VNPKEMALCEKTLYEETLLLKKRICEKTLYSNCYFIKSGSHAFANSITAWLQ